MLPKAIREVMSSGLQVQVSFHSEGYSVDGDMWALRNLALPRVDCPTPRTFFQDLFRTEFARDDVTLARGYVSSTAAAEQQQTARNDAGAFSHVAQMMDIGNDDAMKIEMVMEPAIENDTRERPIIEERPCKRSRSSSMGESESPTMPNAASL